MKTAFKVFNIVHMIMFWVSFIAFCYPIVMEMKGELALNISAFGLLGLVVFLCLWAFTVPCWFEGSKK